MSYTTIIISQNYINEVKASMLEQQMTIYNVIYQINLEEEMFTIQY